MPFKSALAFGLVLGTLATAAGDIPLVELKVPEVLEQVVVGHGDEEGPYRVGSGFSGKRAEERIRVTVCYFVTPNGPLTHKDMKAFAEKFKEWDKKAIWGGSFVLPQSEPVSLK